MTLSRRDMLKFTGGAAAVAATGLYPSLSWADDKEIPIGLQLYSVRHECAKDLPGVLKKVAEMGYAGVEFAGYHGHSPDDIRKMLDENGLKCCGTHTGLDSLQGDALKGTIAFHKTIGNKYLIVPWMAHAMLASPEKCKATAKIYNDLAKKVADEGMVVGYHAHGHDFQKVGDSTGWELFFDACDPAVVMQLDTGNCLGGGGDPVAILKKYPGRSKTVHLKEHGGGADAVIGEGNVDWKAVFAVCESTGGTEWYIVEHERGGDAMDNVHRCLKNLREMGK
jgi:sugar phosphate isomerase/epimerase